MIEIAVMIYSLKCRHHKMVTSVVPETYPRNSSILG